MTQDESDRSRLTEVSERIADEGIELLSLTRKNVEASEELRGRYDALGVFDSIHLSVAWTNDDPIGIKYQSRPI